MGIAIVAFYCAFYLFLNYEGIVYRNGILLTTELNIFGHLFKLPVELLIGFVAIIFLFILVHLLLCFFQTLKLSNKEKTISENIIKEITSRLSFLNNLIIKS